MSYVYLHIIYGLQYSKRLLFAMLLSLAHVVFFSHAHLSCYFFCSACFIHFDQQISEFCSSFIIQPRVYTHTHIHHSMYLLLKFEYLFDLLRKNLYNIAESTNLRIAFIMQIHQAHIFIKIGRFFHFILNVDSSCTHFVLFAFLAKNDVRSNILTFIPGKTMKIMIKNLRQFKFCNVLNIHEAK